VWDDATARFERHERGGGIWHGRDRLPETWTCRIEGLLFRISPTNFGHLGVFPEQRDLWPWIRERCREAAEAREAPPRLLNLFAYTGGSSLAAASGGAEVTHCDASKGIVRWASENADAQDLGPGSIRWIIDDARKFLAREARRESLYDAIVLDPPSFGRGPKGQVWKLEESIGDLLAACVAVLSQQPIFLLLSAHTPGLGPMAFRILLEQALGPAHVGHYAHGEMALRGAEDVHPLPSGTWATWSVGPAPEVRD
jgi:23S rRNA (cytosine1962-C5)-methyltransferase